MFFPPRGKGVGDKVDTFWVVSVVQPSLGAMQELENEIGASHGVATHSMRDSSYYLMQF